MYKIKISEKEIEIEGKIEKGKVTPFGTSAHIPFKKIHTGKSISVILPKEEKYIWLINSKQRKQLLNSAKKKIKIKNGKLEHYRMGLIKELEGEQFSLDSLVKILELSSDDKLVKKVEKFYNLK